MNQLIEILDIITGTFGLLPIDSYSNVPEILEVGSSMLAFFKLAAKFPRKYRALMLRLAAAILLAYSFSMIANSDELNCVVPPNLETRTQDALGSGSFLAPRGNRIHKAIDFVVEPNQPVLAPATGSVVRTGRPYSDSELSLVIIQSGDLTVRILYIKSVVAPGDKVFGGITIIGYTQDIRSYYGPSITPHIHIDVTLTSGLRVDPLSDNLRCQ